MGTLLMDRIVRDFWVNELQPPLSGLDIYTDYPRMNSGRDRRETVFRLNVNARELTRISEGYDYNTWMLACYFAFLYRMSGEQDQIVGVKDAQHRLLPLRVRCEAGTSFKDLYRTLLDKWEALDFAALPLQEIERLTGQSPLIQTIFGEDASYGASCLNWHVKLVEGEGLLHIAYDKNLFKESTVRKFASHFECIVTAAMADENAAIGNIRILTEEDVEAYTELNNTKKAWPSMPQHIPDMLRLAVERCGDRVALSSGDRRLTYAELNRLSDQVARILLNRGLKKGDFVSIFMERSMEAIIGMLGVVKAGGAYVPLDPEHPEDRNAYIIADTSSRIVITKESYTPQLSALLDEGSGDVSLLCLDTQLDGDADADTGEPDIVEISSEDTAYVIYTSGTTGRPKGVLIPHAGVVNLALATIEQLRMTEQDVILQYSTFSFDASVYDIFSALCCGARLHLLSNEQRYSVDSFTSAIEETGATRIGILPTVFFNQLSSYLSVEEAAHYVKIQSFVIGGEALPGESVRTLQKKLTHQPIIVNAYGPTEVTVATTTHIIEGPVPDEWTTVSIGKPLANYEVLIVNEKDQLCPLNVVGELLIHSVGLAKGYLNQPGKTEEAFVTDPVNPDSGKKYYRSGDLVRLQENGIEYVGRKDLQVKIRGYRIEIGEIEENLAKHDAIRDTAIIVKEDESGEKLLAAFYTLKGGVSAGKTELASFLKTKVPAYMVPSYFVCLDVMPLSPTGKIDRKRLGVMEIPDFEEEENADFAAPENELQKEIATAWEKVLRRKSIGIHDDFFEIGGHSLKILETLVLLKPSFPMLKISDFFSYPTISKLADRVTELKHTASGEHAAPGRLGEIVDLAEYPRSFGNESLTEYNEGRQSHILLTGATGYLGSSLLREWLRTTDSLVYCLIRPVQGEDPYQRLSKVMRGYFGPEIDSLMEGRVFAVQGDLEQPNLGLNERVLSLLEDKIDSIVHCGAEVKHFGDPEYFAKVNVESTDRLMGLARDKKIRFHYVSTLGIPEDLAFGGQWERFTGFDGYDDTVSTDNVYTNSKLAAERLVVKTCQEEGVPVTVYRVGNLSCHSETGVFQRNIDNNAFYRMLKAMILLGKAPSVSWQVDITPVNYAAEAITALALQKETAGRLFHICNPVQLSYTQMIDYFRQYGYQIDLLDWPEYESWLLDSNVPKDSTGMELAMAQLEGDGAKNSPYRFACPHTVEYLQGTPVVCKEPDREYMTRLADHAVSVGYFPKPKVLIEQ
ncbi:amino acid adenylation domain-containing protein [Paenibacillus sp. FSL R5-0407]|uniref:non-ribosomal peptide synthetase family protein n=1 Tax=Paenibacillus sp. FSL R5-0407 TaxID=2975320 RepID=UPI0030FB1957